MDAIIRFLQDTGFYLFSQDGNWRCLIMLGIACVLLYLGIVKKFEPLLLVPIAFGMLITNLPGANMFHEIFFAGGHIHWDLIGGHRPGGGHHLPSGGQHCPGTGNLQRAV